MTIHTDPAAELSERAAARLPGGVNSNVRIPTSQVFFDRGEGARLWDVQGRNYVDYLLGQGPNILGHAPEWLQDTVAAAVRKGMVFGAQHELEVRAAEQVCDILGWPDMLRFGVSGTESVQAALRLARAATGRRRFVRFAGHYHGWLDNVLLAYDSDGAAGPASAGQVRSHLDDAVVLPWNDLDAVAAALEADDIAAIITEPMMLNTGAILPHPGYLQGLRDLCDSHGVVLVFDEVITGFRIALGGAAERFGVVPDLAVYGKAIGAGWPVSALAGKAHLMARFGTGEVNHSGTFNASVMAMAAVIGATGHLRDADAYQRMEHHGHDLMTLLTRLSNEHGIGLYVQGVGMAFHATFDATEEIHGFRDLRRTDTARYERFAAVLAEHGVWVAARGIWYVSAAHTDDDLAETGRRVAAAMSAFAESER